MRKNSGLTVLVLGACLLGLTSCGCLARGSVPRTVAATPSGGARCGAPDGGYWWSCRFKVSWPPAQDPDFAVDLLLAHAVVGPVLREYEHGMTLWRFHRRAARDKTGHQFSFLFHSDPATAVEVFRKIVQTPTLREALNAGIVETVNLDDPGKPIRPRVEDTSDPAWSPSLQRSWPSFIMGVSSLWLGLIDEAAAEELPVDGAGTDTDIHAVLERYREANTRVTSIWHKEGQHAFLHHLNAIFGYEPMLLKKELTF
jgi:hypothetical protein